MLQNILQVLVVSVICLAWGFPVTCLQQKKNNFLFSFSEFMIFSFFCGIVLLALLGSWLCLFMSLQFWTLAIITIPVIVVDITWLSKRLDVLPVVRLHFRKNIPYLIFLISSVSLFFVLGSNRPVMEDTDLYHLQIIRFDHEYGMVPGVANLYLRYGSYSAWLQLISFFLLPFKQTNFLFLNLTAGCWFCFFLVQKIKRHQKDNKPENKSMCFFYLFALLFMFLEWNLFRENASSTSYDFIVTALTIMTLSLVTENLFFQKQNNELVIFLLAISIPFFKISGAAILFVLAIYFLVTRKLLKTWLVAASIFVFFVIPFFIKNYVQTGYILFPYTFIHPFAPDWEVPKALLKNFTDYLGASNKYLNQVPPLFSDYDPSSLSWIKGWPARLVYTDKILMSFAAVSLPLSFFIKNRITGRKKILVIYYATLLSLIPWFFSAPDPRFAYGSLLFCAFMLPGFFLGRFMRTIFINLSLIAVSICIWVYAVKKIDLHNTIKPSAIFHPSFQKIIIHGREYNIPEKINNNWNIRCYDTPQPCIYQLNPYLEARGQSIRDGFIMKPITDSSFILNYNY
jgi:hypothetical protein